MVCIADLVGDIQLSILCRNVWSGKQVFVSAWENWGASRGQILTGYCNSTCSALP